MLFRAVTTAMRRILLLFKDLEISDPTVYREMLRHCFDHTIFARSLGRIRQAPQHHQAQSTRFGQLLDSGYNLYEIHDLQQTSDRDEVDFRHFAINTTPDSLRDPQFGFWTLSDRRYPALCTELQRGVAARAGGVSRYCA